ncbi:MAG: OadG family protein [Candidatus Fermentibacteraceae bacterium]|nr:OadG family protein [Candidatus Fermentibacteraceae bacterium]MBN2608469.1 OadG family protein [Candidatus Fermentibacteraceae bacterium]
MNPQLIIRCVISAQGTGDMGNGLGIALVGMVAVFTGLVVLALALPVLENWVEKKLGAGGNARGGEASSDCRPRPLSHEEVVAVSAAVHAHFCLLDQMENMKLTWETYEKPYTPWRLAGRAELLQERGSLQNRSRSR